MKKQFRNLSLKLFEWTSERWIITFSKVKGEISIKDQEQKKKINIIKEMKETDLYKKVLEKFPDAELLDVISNKEKDNQND